MVATSGASVSGISFVSPSSLARSEAKCSASVFAAKYPPRPLAIAPALTEANVGVAMGSGTDVARESADVVLLGNELLKFVETLQVARCCRRIIWFNFAGTLAVDSLGMGLAAFGMLNPLLAAFIHVSSELAFI